MSRHKSRSGKGPMVGRMVYFREEEMVEEIKSEAARQDRSTSWLVAQAWRLAKEEIAKYQTPPVIE